MSKKVFRFEFSSVYLGKFQVNCVVCYMCNSHKSAHFNCADFCTMALMCRWKGHQKMLRMDSHGRAITRKKAFTSIGEEMSWSPSGTP